MEIVNADSAEVVGQLEINLFILLLLVFLKLLQLLNFLFAHFLLSCSPCIRDLSLRFLVELEVFNRP